MRRSNKLQRSIQVWRVAILLLVWTTLLASAANAVLDPTPTPRRPPVADGATHTTWC